jgi:hypothetical protein
MLLTANRLKTFRALAATGLLFVSSALLASTALAADRLALVIGEAGYIGDPLPTAAADATLVAKTLGAQGFDVTDLHELNTADLAAGYQAFLAKARAAPTTEITAYFAGLGVNVGCDDYLLPIDAQIAAEADVPKIALSMTQVLNDLARTGSQVRVVLLDGARPIPPSVATVALPQGLIPLTPTTATSFGLAAEIHDYEAPPKAGDANDAYATGLTASLQQPFADVDTMLRATRLTVHQATAGGQTPWHASASATPPFAYPVGATAQQIQTAAAGLPITPVALSSMPADVAYWSAIWRNTAEDYTAYLSAFGASAPQDQAERVRMLLALLSAPNPVCAAAAPAVPAASAIPAPVPVTVIGGVYCPEGYDGYCQPPVGCTGWSCLPPPPPPCVPWHWGCGLPPPPLWCVPWHPGCPGPHPLCVPWHPGCPMPPPVCVPWHPGCPIHPICIPWHPGCPGGPGPSCIPWHPGCPGGPPPSCVPWHPGCPGGPVLNCVPWHPGCPGGPPPSCVPWHLGCPGGPVLNCVPWHPGCPGGPPPSCVPWHLGCPGGPVLNCVPWHPGCPGGPPPSCVPWHPGCPGGPVLTCVPWHPGCPGGPPPSCVPWHQGCPGGVVKPIGPVGPVGPFKPIAPFKPVVPIKPVGPVGPVSHVCVPWHPGCPKI